MMKKLLFRYTSTVAWFKLVVLSYPHFRNFSIIPLIGLGFLLYPDIVYCSGADNIDSAPTQSWNDPHKAIDRSIEDNKTMLNVFCGAVCTMALGANRKTAKLAGLGLSLITQRTGSYLLEQQRRFLHSRFEMHLELNREISPRGQSQALPAFLLEPVEKLAPSQGVNPSSSGMVDYPNNAIIKDNSIPNIKINSINEPSSSISDKIQDLIDLPIEVSPELGMIMGVYYLLIVAIISFILVMVSFTIFNRKTQITKRFIKNKLLLRILSFLSVRSIVIFSVLGFFNLIFAIITIQVLIDNW